MSAHKMSTSSPKTKLDNPKIFWGVGIFACSILLVLFCTLSPFNFSFKNGFSIKYIISSFYHPSNVFDAIANVFLFLPFGFSFTYLLQKTKLKGVAKIVLILTSSFGLSLTVEVLQAFLPSRDSTLLDLLTNSVGGCLGYLCFHQRLTVFSWLLAFVKKNLSLKKLTASFIGYTLLVFLVAIALQNSTNLSNWDETFPLLLGNEKLGGRPWQGAISEVFITNRAISTAEVASVFSNQDSSNFSGDSLLAAYQLTGKGNYLDQVGNLDLFWQGKPLVIQSERGVFLTTSRWLETKTSATFITQKTRETSQFTLSAIVAAASIIQKGPARIISLSGDPYRRNFTLGQSGTELVFRLRTPITGLNGANPELIVPNIFTDTKFHHLIITYDGSNIKFYVDQLQHFYSLKLSPDITLFRYLLPFGNIRLTALSIGVYKAFYYGIVFVPLGCLLALITIIVRAQFIFYILLSCSGILLPSLILESILAGSEKIVRPEYLLLGISITGVTMLVVRTWALSWLKGNVVS